jgi:hypothetical protein
VLIYYTQERRVLTVTQKASRHWTRVVLMASHLPFRREPAIVTVFLGARKDGHILDARLRKLRTREGEWYVICREIDQWTFDVQQLLVNNAPELLNDFNGDWKPNPLQSRKQISAQLHERLNELSQIIQKLRGQPGGNVPAELGGSHHRLRRWLLRR